MIHKDILVRSAVLIAVAVVTFVLLVFAYRRPASHWGTVKAYPDQGVMIAWERNTVFVKLDDKEEWVPRTELGRSSIYQEALGRIPLEERPAKTEIRWRRVCRWWLLITMVTSIILFRYWEPRRPYIEGQKGVKF